jgi:hypothetical protein
MSWYTACTRCTRASCTGKRSVVGAERPGFINGGQPRKHEVLAYATL